MPKACDVAVLINENGSQSDSVEPQEAKPQLDSLSAFKHHYGELGALKKSGLLVDKDWA